MCVSAGDIELEEEVWACGVDHFSQHVRKFESQGSPSADISAVVERSLPARRGKRSAMSS